MKYLFILLTLLFGCSTPNKKLDIDYYSDCSKIESCYYIAKENCPMGYTILDERRDEEILAPEEEWNGTDPTYNFRSEINYVCSDITSDKK